MQKNNCLIYKLHIVRDQYHNQQIRIIIIYNKIRMERVFYSLEHLKQNCGCQYR